MGSRGIGQGVRGAAPTLTPWARRGWLAAAAILLAAAIFAVGYLLGDLSGAPQPHADNLYQPLVPVAVGSAASPGALGATPQIADASIVIAPAPQNAPPLVSQQPRPSVPAAPAPAPATAAPASSSPSPSPAPAPAPAPAAAAPSPAARPSPHASAPKETSSFDTSE